MSRLFFSPASRRDLLQILDYIAQDNPQAATRFVDQIEQKCHSLAESPDMGFPRNELLPQLRVWPVGNYLVFYRPADDGIEVVRVVHGARDIPKLFE